MASVVVIDFPVEGECCSVMARSTPEGWRYRWVYDSIWDDIDAELLGIVPHKESAEQSSIAEVLPDRWFEMRPYCIHQDWLAWFRDAISNIVAGTANEATRARITKRWQQVLQG